MVYILLSVFLTLLLFIIFRGYATYGVNTLQALVVNYFVCAITGSLFLNDWSALFDLSQYTVWLPFAFFLGVLFISIFYLTARTAQLISISVTSIASKMSLAIPVAMSLFVFQIESKHFDWINYTGLLLSLVAIYLSSVREDGGSLRRSSHLWLPFAVFFGSGAVDTTINFTSYNYLSGKDEAIFPIIAFFSAGVVGSLVLIVRRIKIQPKAVMGGIALGVPNFFTIYFIIKALASFNHDGAIVFPLNNIGTIVVSTLYSVIFLKEVLSKKNIIGVILATLCIFLISYQELISLFN